MGRGQGNVQMGGGGGYRPMSESALAKRLEQNQTGAGVDASQLSKAEAKAIRDYMGKGGEKKYDITAEDFNRALYDPEWFAKQPTKFKQDVMAQARELDAALSKIKNYEGEVYRLLYDPVGMKITQTASGAPDIIFGPAAKNMGSRAAALEPGKIITMKSPTSASRVRNAVNFNYRVPLQTGQGVTRIRIQSKTGKAIENVGAEIMKAEREVLFRAGTKFKVVSRKWNRRMKTWDVVMKEI